MHHPPFIHDEDEVHQYFNWPLVPRRRLLALARKYNVGHFLCGHTHTTTSVSTSDNAITILTTAGKTELLSLPLIRPLSPVLKKKFHHAWPALAR